MPERPRQSGSTVSSLTCVLACGAALCALPAIGRTQSLPESIRACAAQTDAGRRHACYDREVGRILESEKKASAQRRAATPCCAKSARIEPRSAPAAQAAPVARTAQTAAAATRAPTAPRAPTRHEPDRISARVASIDNSPDVLILHLDNGETWQQTDTTTGALSLRPGDRITIEKHLGSYWLSARHISGMRVRRRAD